jgi:hypothetical protein
MPPVTEQIACPKNPDHGIVSNRWLSPEEREMIRGESGDVFEIDCPDCGKYEYRSDVAPAK